MAGIKAISKRSHRLARRGSVDPEDEQAADKGCVERAREPESAPRAGEQLPSQNHVLGNSSQACMQSTHRRGRIRLRRLQEPTARLRRGRNGEQRTRHTRKRVHTNSKEAGGSVRLVDGVTEEPWGPVGRWERPRALGPLPPTGVEVEDRGCHTDLLETKRRALRAVAAGVARSVK